jgi:glycosyltransferase involved in cell wall biosynthesis
MVHYYAKLDVYVCVSDAEGTPNPVLEAMACGVPIISTDVGIVGELMGTLQSQFILTERSIKSLQRALIIILQTPGLLSSLSSENLSSITSWSWHRQADKFRTFFLDALHERAKRAAEQ